MLQVKKKICAVCNTEQIIWKNHNGNKYCRQCWLKEHSAPIPKKLPTPIKAKSDKKAAEDQLYSVLRKKFFQDTNNHNCKAHLAGCSLSATDIHHTAGRGVNYLDVKTWIPLCRNCHTYIELHPEDAKALNFSQNRI